MILYNGIKLYHGSYCEVQDPDLAKCRSGKDFGRGFYLTTDKKQATRFTKTAILKAISDGLIADDQASGCISEFIYTADPALSIFEFADADREWLHCVVSHRKASSILKPDKWIPFDIIAGKIANDHTNLVITTYMDGLYGDIGSVKADRIAIGFLEPDNLKDQICFRTEKALSCIEFAGSSIVKL